MREVLTFKGTVYPWHCDHMGHMNVMWYTGRFDEATWAFLGLFGLKRDFFEHNNIGMAALEQTVNYLRELHAGDQIEVYSHLVEVRPKVMRFAHRMVHVDSGETCAKIINTAACLDTGLRKAREFPAEVHQKLEVALSEGAEV
ncbi:acyl-CoA thioesterase [Aestuariispira ectoiniformans]|uniref:acyl-CoA thioesterase n=1 Tax=Aestuariispira ectoiniformans TaxID=2775080 RepID=UPI00223B2CF2|nr:thioesterase family protein [Aestuariispira ectoiniformans]